MSGRVCRPVASGSFGSGPHRWVCHRGRPDITLAGSHCRDPPTTMSQAGLQARAGSPDPSRGTVRTLHAVLGVYKRVNKAQSRRQTHTCAKNGTLRWAWLCFTSLGWSCASGARSDSGVPGRSGVNCNLGRGCVCLWLCAAVGRRCL